MVGPSNRNRSPDRLVAAAMPIDFPGAAAVRKTHREAPFSNPSATENGTKMAPPGDGEKTSRSEVFVSPPSARVYLERVMGIEPTTTALATQFLFLDGKIIL